ncbi:MAG: TlyA family RNA methyltransferase [Selenomonadaceae bacterium]|nr:TlyA family RNA methyltransferase [Selenomonadaceae bacterium]
MKKKRLDMLLVERGLVASRERAKRVIMAGQVLVDGQKVDKAGTTVKGDANLRLLGEDLPYVSRGGLKLAKAMQEFGLELQGKVTADIGASTGGFTDCMLQNGARKVYAIDVGYGQLAWKLRTDERVVNMERTNIRHVTPELLDDAVDFASIDVAFISLGKVLPAVKALLKPSGEIVALIKPQFEAGREHVGKKGVVRDPAVHEEVISHVVGFCREDHMVPMDLTYSPVKGPEGNIEYLLRISLDRGQEDRVPQERISQVVKDAHHALDGQEQR